MNWNKIKDKLPSKDGYYLVAYKKEDGRDRQYGVSGFTRDAYKFDEYDFEEYRGKKRQVFYSYSSEWGYTDTTDYLEYWSEIEEP